jgi:hypothetical protein
MSPQLLNPGLVTDPDGGAHCCNPHVGLQQAHSTIHAGRMQT